jgi:hypothetical protein
MEKIKEPKEATKRILVVVVSRRHHANGLVEARNALIVKIKNS